MSQSKKALNNPYTNVQRCSSTLLVLDCHSNLSPEQISISNIVPQAGLSTTVVDASTTKVL
jgi:phosphatidylserine decarboxylase